jgi:hypothetical protein
MFTEEEEEAQRQLDPRKAIMRTDHMSSIVSGFHRCMYVLCNFKAIVCSMVFLIKFIVHEFSHITLHAVKFVPVFYFARVFPSSAAREVAA